MKLDFFEKIYKKKNKEKHIVYENEKYTIIPVDPNYFDIKTPINFNIFLLMEKSRSLIQYYKKGHRFTLEEISKLKKNTRGRIFVFKKEFEKYKAYREFNIQFNGSKRIKNQISINRISLARNTGTHTLENQELNLTLDTEASTSGINENATFTRMIEKLNALSHDKRNEEKTKLLFDTMRHYGHDTYKRIKAFQEREKTLFPIARILFKENSVIRLFYLALFFCVKNKVSDRNIIFHIIMNILSKNLTHECREAYNEYWSNLVFKEGISADAIVNITDTMKFCHQFETIISYLTPSLEENKASGIQKQLEPIKSLIKNIAYK